MAIPILKQGTSLVATLQSAVSDTDLERFRDDLVERVGTARARGIVLDVGTVDVIDSFSARTLRDIAHSARLRGARTIVVGIQPEVVMTLIHFGSFLGDLETALDLEEGLAMLHQGAAEGRPHGRA